MYTKSIFWFRQDLRVQDNTGLFECIKNSQEILPIFILDTHIISGFGGLSDQKFGFIREALELVTENLKKIGGSGVIVFHGKPEEIIPQLVKKYSIEAVYTNTSYGTYGTNRDAAVKKNILAYKCDFLSFKDFLLVEPHEIEQRKVFTPFYKLWQKYVEANPSTLKISKLNSLHFSQLTTEEQSQAKDFIPLEKHPYFTMEFGEKRLKQYIRPDYDTYRNDLDKDGTSKLSPYLRFGIFSIREIYLQAKHISPTFISELAWREFWWHIFHYFPETKTTEFQEKRRHIQRSTQQDMFQKWCQGETGYPVVDAAMKQLNQTNWMHGRARMIVASFLTKDMHIDWRLGEAYFKEKLLDYDEAVNLGNWQWSASVGADPKPLRIFNPILQSEKFDTEGKFIKKYLPQLEGEKIEAIHNPLENNLGYIPPIVDHRIETGKARELYKG